MPLINKREVSTGKSFPPEREIARYREFAKYSRYSNGKFNGLWDGVPSRLHPNLFKDVMDFWKLMTIGDRPTINIKDNDRANEFVGSVELALFDAAEDVVADIIRYGVGCFVVEKDLFPQSLDPLYWFPVRPAEDVYETDKYTADIVAYSFNRKKTNQGDASQNVFDTNTPTHLMVKTFQGSTVERAIHTMKGTQIGPIVNKTVSRTASWPTIVPVTLSAEFYGVSDFKDMEAYVAELHRRESRISKALDRHTNPHLGVPESSIVTEADGSIRVDQEGMVFPMSDDVKVPPQYIVWDAKFDSQEDAISRAELRILRSSKISPILFKMSKGETMPNVVSGPALRRLALPTVHKIKALRRRLNESIKDVLIKLAELHGVLGGEVISFGKKDINILWSPELSTGIIDEAESVSQLVQTEVLDPVTAKQMVEKLSLKEAKAKYDEYKQKPEQNMPGQAQAGLVRSRGQSQGGRR